MKYMVPWATLWTVAIVLLSVMPGCSDRSDGPEAYPAIIDGQKGWSLVNAKGQLIAEDRFERYTTAATCGRVWSRTDEGYWKLYDAAGKQELVSPKEFRYVSYFHGGRALVAGRGEGVTVIDTDGEIRLHLDSIEGRPVESFLFPADGLVVYSVTGKGSGVINLDGEVIISARYTSIGTPAYGRIVASDVKYPHVPSDSAKQSVISVFDYDGNKLFSVSPNKYDLTAESFIGGYLPVAKNDGDALSWGLLDAQGETVVKPSAAYSSILDVRGGKFLYVNGEGKIGLNGIDGEQILSARYTDAFFIDNDHLAVSETEVEDEGVFEYQVITTDDKPITDRTFAGVSPRVGDAMFVCLNSGNWTLMNFKGEINDEAPRMVTVDFDMNPPDYVIQSDHIDIDALIDALRISPVGLDGLTFASSVEQALDRQVAASEGVERSTPTNVSFTDEVNIFPTVDGEVVSETVVFPEKLSKPTYRQERVVDFVWGNYYTYRINNVPTGFSFTRSHPARFTVMFNNYGKLRGRLGELYKNLLKRMEKIGTVEQSNDAAAIIALPNGKKALVTLQPTMVTLTMGIIPAGQLVVHPYAGNREELTDDYGKGP